MARFDPFLNTPSNLAHTAGQRGIRRVASVASGGVGISVTAALVNGITEAAGRLPQIGQAMGVALENNLRAADRLAVNRRLAEGARDAVVDAYVGRTAIRPSDPRNEGRYGPGVLAAALASDENVSGSTRDRISFINQKHMDESAAHWWRINFGSGSNTGGVGGASGRRPQSFALVFQGPRGGTQQVGVLQFADAPSRPIPAPAFLWDSEGFFHVRKGWQSEPRRSLSSRGAQYLDAGLRYLGNNVGPAYLVMFNEALRDPRTAKAVERRFGAPVTATNLRGIR